uniref:Uncharacterized protein n=1 Tax=viral metagenome TaxID=1070528 RepID=A0A6C0BRB3_9ZZZZ
MDTVLDNILGPLSGKVYCNYFYVIMILALLTLLGAIFTLLMSIMDKGKNFTVLLFILLNNFLLYFNVRLVYSMCMNSM